MDDGWLGRYDWVHFLPLNYLIMLFNVVLMSSIMATVQAMPQFMDPISCLRPGQIAIARWNARGQSSPIPNPLLPLLLLQFYKIRATKVAELFIAYVFFGDFFLESRDFESEARLKLLFNALRFRPRRGKEESLEWSSGRIWVENMKNEK